MSNNNDDDIPRTPVVPPAGGLRLKTSLSGGKQVQAEIHNKWNTVDSVEAWAKSKGIPLERPHPEEGFPHPLTAKDLTTSNFNSFTELFVRWNAWKVYVNSLLVPVAMHLLQLKNEREDMRHAIRREEKQKNKTREKAEKLSDAAITDLVAEHPRHTELVQLEQDWKQKKELLEARADECERSLNLISRVVTVRGQEIEQSRNESNLPGRSGRRLL